MSKGVLLALLHESCSSFVKSFLSAKTSFLSKSAGSGRSWRRIMHCGLICSGRDGERIGLPSMPLLARNHGKMHTRCRTDATGLDCESPSLLLSVIGFQIPGGPSSSSSTYENVCNC